MKSSLWRKYEEYEGLLFEPTEDNKYKFQPFDEQDAEYWFHIYSDWIFSMEIRLSEDYTGNKDEPNRNIVGKVIQSDILGEITKAIAKCGAIMEWYKKKELKCPEIDSLLPFDEEWIAMEEGYDIRVEKWYRTKLDKIKNKFSRIDDINHKIVNSELFNNKDWSVIYRLAEDMRFRKEQGEFETYEAAYEYAAKNNTVNGESITVKQMKNNYYKTKSSSTRLDD